MTRLQAKEALIALGIESPTDENITNYLNALNGEVQKYKVKADEADSLQKQLDEINKQNMSDIEKANAERDEALNSIAGLQSQIKKMELKNNLADKGIVGDIADQLVEALNGGTFDASILGNYIAEREKKAVSEFEKQALAGMPNPDGSKPEGGEKTEAIKTAENVASILGGTNKQSADIINAYINN